MSESERPSEPIKPCPFCGSRAVMDTTGAGCSNKTCDAYMANVYLRTWNRRSPSSVSGAEPETPATDFVDGLVRSTHVLKDRLEFIWRTMPAHAKAANGSFENWMGGLDAAIAATPEFRGKPLVSRVASSEEAVTSDTRDAIKELRETYEVWMRTDEAPDPDACSDAFAQFALVVQGLCYSDTLRVLNVRAVSEQEAPS